MNLPTGAQPLLVYFGHHKCGSMWISGIVAAVAQALNLNHQTANFSRQHPPRVAEFIETMQPQVLTMLRSRWSYVTPLPEFRGFHVVRDPRDVIVSAYFSHKFSHPLVPAMTELPAVRQQLHSLPKEEGLAYTLEYMEERLREMADWHYGQRENILEMHLEAVTAQPEEYFSRIFRFLGLMPEPAAAGWKQLGRRLLQTLAPGARRPNEPQLDEEQLRTIVWENRFEAKAGNRKPGEEDVNSHYRKGVAGDWRNHFTPEHIAYFKQHYNDILLKLGYETNPDWT